VPGTARLAVAMGLVAFGLDLFVARRSLHLRAVLRAVAINVVLPVAILALTYALASPKTPIAVNIALALLIVAANRTVSLPHRVSTDRAHIPYWCC